MMPYKAICSGSRVVGSWFVVTLLNEEYQRASLMLSVQQTVSSLPTEGRKVLCCTRIGGDDFENFTVLHGA